MSRLIDADALIEDILALPNCPNGFSDTYDKSCIIGVIDEQPTIEPKKGKWIHHEGGYSDHYECTACGKAIVLTGRWNYCPNCGSYNGGENEM